jgi:hypothetical protein
LNREILKSIGKRGNSIDYNDVEEYLRNRYYDTSRGYGPVIYQQQPQQQQQPSRETLAVNKAEPRQQQHSNAGSQKAGDGIKVETAAAANEASQSQDQIFDEGSMIDDDDEMQVKYLYSLLKNRIPNSI